MPSVDLGNIEKASTLIDPLFRNTPQFEDETLRRALGRRVLLKVETLNPIRSFKGRGADFFARTLDPKQKIVCASAGNFGQAMAYAAGRRGLPVEVFVAEDVNPAKAERMRLLGAKITMAGKDFEGAKHAARQLAARNAEYLFVEDGEEEALTEGAGTIGIELLQAGTIDSAVVPIGDGALISGVATWMKAHSPQTKIIGVCPKGAPAMFESWKKGRIISGESHTIADGIAVTAPVPKAVGRLKDLVDDIVLVDDDDLIDAMKLSLSALGLVLEPSGAAGLAAIRRHQLSGERFATILTGSNVHPKMLPELLHSGSGNGSSEKDRR